MGKASDTTDTIALDTPIKRGDQRITEVVLRKPSAGELRGVNLTDLLQMSVDALTIVLPRITTPTLLKEDVRTMDPADLVQLGAAVANFLLPKAVRSDTDSPSA